MSQFDELYRLNEQVRNAEARMRAGYKVPEYHGLQVSLQDLIQRNLRGYRPDLNFPPNIHD